MRRKKHTKYTGRIFWLIAIIATIIVITMISIRPNSKENNTTVEKQSAKDDVDPVITLIDGERKVIAKRRKIYTKCKS